MEAALFAVSTSANRARIRKVGSPLSSKNPFAQLDLVVTLQQVAGRGDLLAGAVPQAVPDVADVGVGGLRIFKKKPSADLKPPEALRL